MTLFFGPLIKIVDEVIQDGRRACAVLGAIETPILLVPDAT